MITRTLCSAAGVAVLAAALVAQDKPSARPPLGEPGISPDGSTIAFVSGGDIWEVPARGGNAHLLVSHPATESRPMYSPDGARLAFTSTRTGNGDVYVLTLATGQLERLTYDDANEQVSGWSPDGRYVYFSTGSHDLGSMMDVFRIAADGGMPMPVAADRYATEYFAAPAPSGDAVAITARGFAGLQWWRNGHSHLDESEIWIVRSTGTARVEYTPVTTGGAKDAWPMWGSGQTLYYTSDRNGAQNIWMQTIGGAARPVTAFKNGRVLWPTMSGDGRTIAFERNLRIWTADTASGTTREVPITLRGAPAAAAVEHKTFTDQLQDLALSPDGRKIAFTVHGEVFSAPAGDGGDAVRVTKTIAAEFGLVWAPDSRRLVYASDRDGTDHLYLYDFGSSQETPLTSGALRDHAPQFSPDGKWIAFERGDHELRVLDLATRQEHAVAAGIMFAPLNGSPHAFVWSPDSKYLAYIGINGKDFANVHLAAVDAAAPAAAPGEGRAITFLANTNAGSLAWSPDGTYLTFVTSQRTEPGQIVRVDLAPRTPRFREDRFRDLFRDESPRTESAPPSDTKREASAAPAARDGADPKARRPASPPKPVQIVFDGIRRRASAVPIGLDVSSQTISPDGKWLLVVASAAEQQNLYVYPLDELSRDPAVARQLTSTAGAKRNAQFTPDSKEIVYLDRGRVFTVSLDRREPKAASVSAALDVDFSREKVEVFQQAWSDLRDQFFDEKMNGVDWTAVRQRYAPFVAGAETPDEMRRVVLLMLGELNASHMGISAPPQTIQTTLGRLVVDFDGAEYEASGRLRIAHVVPLGPASLGGVKPGDYLLAVDGYAVDRRTNADALLDHTLDRRVVLSVAASPNAPPREVVVKPVNQATERGLRYREWVDQRREYVNKASNGRLGYVHMLDMSAEALTALAMDLDADNHSRDGVVVDVRNNNGGFVNVYAIDVLARRGYFNMARRGVPLPPVSSRTLLGQRALELPTILVTNQHSLSDAEDFTEGYRTLKLGKVVGEPTAGWIIYTGSVTLMDGSVLRMPGTKIFASDGTPMEMHPRPVDVPVVRPVGESYSGKDVQLDTAVAELLKQIGPPKRATNSQRQ